MKISVKLSTIICALIIGSTCCFAIETGKLHKKIEGSDLNKTATIAISVRKVSTGNVIYEKNESKLLHPASALKIFSLKAALNELGYDYMFKTEFYKDAQNNLYIKTGADPTLTTSRLKQAFAEIQKSTTGTFKNLYVDDGIIDKKEFSEGWMWDDNVNEYTPKVSSYNLDNNVLNINLTEKNGSVSVSTKSSYPTSVIANIKPGAKEDLLDIQRYDWNNPDVTEIRGRIKGSKTLKVPVSSMRRYFIYNTEKCLKDTGIKITGTSFASKKVPDNAVLLTSIMSPITDIIPGILQNSNNVYAQTVYKVAAGKKYNSTGSDYAAGVMFSEYYDKNGVKTEDIIIKDGCGISRNNLISVDWMTKALVMIAKSKDFKQFQDNMARPGDGTLSSRLFDLRDNAWLKTGSLSNISAIAGYVLSKDGNTYAVAIITQNFNKNPKEIKDFEDEIIKYIYNR